jgi:UDP-N-acetylglucosamine acyltransferase
MINPLAHIHPDANIGKDVRIDAFAVVEGKVTIGDGSHIMAGATILDHTFIGKNCTVFPNATVGGIPQDLKYRGEETTVEIGDNTTIRECVTVNRGTVDKWKTVVGKNCLLMAYSHIAHDCIIGNNVIIANAVQMGGHVEIEDYANIGGMTTIMQFSKVGAHTYISGSSGIIKDVPPYIRAGRIPLSYAGVNSIGLQRRGFSIEKINNILEIYRIIYLRGFNTTQAIEYIQDMIPDTEEKMQILKFIHNSKKGILKLVSRDEPEESTENSTPINLKE